jgi:hypothetical protein
MIFRIGPGFLLPGTGGEKHYSKRRRIYAVEG